MEQDFFFNEVRILATMTDQTQVLILKVMPKEGKYQSSRTICLDAKKLAKVNNIELIGSFNPAYRALKNLGLIQKKSNRNKHRLTLQGQITAESNERILDVYNPKHPPAEQTEQKPVENIPDNDLNKAILEDYEQATKENAELLKENKILGEGIYRLEMALKKQREIDSGTVNNAECYLREIQEWKRVFPDLLYYGCLNYADAIMKKLKEYKAAEEDAAKELIAVSKIRNDLIIAFREFSRDCPKNRSKT